MDFENVWISTEISLMYVASGSIDNVPVHGWHQAIIWANDGSVTDAYMLHSASVS